MQGSWCPGVAYQMHSLLMMAWQLHGPRMSGTCGRHCEGCLQRSKPKREGRPWQRRRIRKSRGGPWPAGTAPLWVPELAEVGPIWPGLFLGEGAQEEGWEAPTSEKAQGKAPAVELPPPETDEEMAQCLQEEEKEVEQAQRGQDTATLVVVREAAGPLTWGQVEGLIGPY